MLNGGIMFNKLRQKLICILLYQDMKNDIDTLQSNGSSVLYSLYKNVQFFVYPLRKHEE